MGKKLVLVGGGGHCESVLDSILALNTYEEVVITDNSNIGGRIFGCSVVGDDDILPDLREKGFDYAFISVGSIEDSSLRRRLAIKVQKMGYIFPVICDPSAVISPFAKVKDGTFVGKNAVVNAGALINNHSIINSGAIIEHDCTVGEYSHVSVGAILCGNSCVGSDSLIGAGSTVIQGINIGSKVIVGANSVVLANVVDNRKVFGVVS